MLSAIRHNNYAEFGVKAQVSHVDGFAFTDKLSFDPFSEKKELENSINKHEDRFGRPPKYV